MSPFAKPTMLITFVLVALLAMSSLVDSRPVQAGQRGTPTESLNARNVPAVSDRTAYYNSPPQHQWLTRTAQRLAEPNMKGLISDLTSELGLLSSKTGASSTPTQLPNTTNTTVQLNKINSANNANDAATSATSSTATSSLNVPTTDLQSVQKLLQDLVDSLSRNLKVALANIDELTNIL